MMKNYIKIYLLLKKRKRMILILILSLITCIFFVVFIHNRLWNVHHFYSQTKRKTDFHQFYDINKFVDSNNDESEKNTLNFIRNNRNIYGLLTVLNLSKSYVLNKNFNKALLLLYNHLHLSQDKFIFNTMLLEIAKVQMKQNKFNDAIETLNSIKSKLYLKTILNMKGDIFFILKKYDDAIQFWIHALQLESNVITKIILKMKINSIEERDYFYIYNYQKNTNEN
ncbi:Ancillary SecYEG translocon subunit [Buchnera aphidicola (Thelaxes suberi)]|uniref:tetratricopeptide repeat protein n=1 Tax=Buchnera aphidicola TaxID=9 RepID=UPI003463B309